MLAGHIVLQWSKAGGGTDEAAQPGQRQCMRRCSGHRSPAACSRPLASGWSRGPCCSSATRAPPAASTHLVRVGLRRLKVVVKAAGGAPHCALGPRGLHIQGSRPAGSAPPSPVPNRAADGLQAGVTQLAGLAGRRLCRTRRSSRLLGSRCPSMRLCIVHRRLHLPGHRGRRGLLLWGSSCLLRLLSRLRRCIWLLRRCRHQGDLRCRSSCQRGSSRLRCRHCRGDSHRLWRWGCRQHCLLLHQQATVGRGKQLAGQQSVQGLHSNGEAGVAGGGEGGGEGPISRTTQRIASPAPCIAAWPAQPSLPKHRS